MAKVIFTAIREENRARLHLLNRNMEHNAFVVCWNYNPANTTWDWGAYSDKLIDALSIFVKKCREHDFSKVVEGYAEAHEH